MGAYTVTKGGSIEIDLADDFRDNGWKISGSKAIHSACNSGLIKMREAKYTVGVPNIFRYTVSGYSSGYVQLRVGISSGISVSENGIHTDVITPQEGDVVSFFADGNVTIELLDVSTNTEDSTGTAIYYLEDGNKWIMESSIRPEFMLKFESKFFAFKNGILWESHTNNIRNNFFGIQYSSKVIFICNFEDKKNKIFYNLRLDSKGSWFCPEMTTEITDQFPNGMLSRLKKNNFKLIDGKLWGDILRDVNDPAFATISNPTQRALEALFKARKLQGGYLIITLENNDVTEARLSSVETYYIEAERNF
jgi:hypothetical protein